MGSNHLITRTPSGDRRNAVSLFGQSRNRVRQLILPSRYFTKASHYIGSFKRPRAAREIDNHSAHRLSRGFVYRHHKPRFNWHLPSLYKAIERSCESDRERPRATTCDHLVCRWKRRELVAFSLSFISLSSSPISTPCMPPGPAKRKWVNQSTKIKGKLRYRSSNSPSPGSLSSPAPRIESRSQDCEDGPLPSGDGNETMGYNYGVILLTIHSFSAIIYQSSVGNGTCNLLKHPIGETNNQAKRVAQVLIETSKCQQFFVGKMVRIET